MNLTPFPVIWDRNDVKTTLLPFWRFLTNPVRSKAGRPELKIFGCKTVNPVGFNRNNLLLERALGRAVSGPALSTRQKGRYFSSCEFNDKDHLCHMFVAWGTGVHHYSNLLGSLCSFQLRRNYYNLLSLSDQLYVYTSGN